MKMSGLVYRVGRSVSARLRTAPAVRSCSVRMFSDDTKTTDRWVIGDVDDKATDIFKLVKDDLEKDQVNQEPEVIVAGIGEEQETFVIPPMENDLDPLEANPSDITSADLNDDDDAEADTLQEKVYDNWDVDEGDLILPEMLNWMLPDAQRKPLRAPKKKLWTEFVKADTDPVELALNTELLRLFISPNGRMLPRRFTGLRAKQQRQLATAIKNSRQLGLLPFTSRYPLPSPEQMKMMTAQAVAQYDNFDFDSADHDDKEDEFDAMFVED
ncbi:hypothetical protein LEN26_018511 [Aphanomyces euteiches]|nr:hypothetical protein LEN26_018511 [Aphanomyces euteiches]KAH9127409.1 hypothetical protein AeMF1_002282 [Aphanomyces euteiches]KAH9191559.1 hypothetical protein AeNC1_006458 [Aphanomyces euteiches]